MTVARRIHCIDLDKHIVNSNTQGPKNSNTIIIPSSSQHLFLLSISSQFVINIDILTPISFNLTQYFLIGLNDVMIQLFLQNYPQVYVIECFKCISLISYRYTGDIRWSCVDLPHSNIVEECMYVCTGLQ